MFRPGRYAQGPPFHGAPFALPRPLDRLVERWWRARPRTRVVTGAAVAVLTLAAGLAHAGSSPHGPPVTVLVAGRELLPGDQLDAEAVRRTSWPQDLAPEDALREPGGTVAALTPAGAVVTDRHVGDGGLAAALPDDQVAVPVPSELLPDLTGGTRVALVGAGHDGEATTLSAAATVLGADGTDLWLAVEPASAAAVSGAVATSSIGVVIHPP